MSVLKVGSITSRCSGNEPAFSPGEDRENSGNRAYCHCILLGTCGCRWSMVDYITLIKHEYNKLCIVFFCYYHRSASNFLLNLSHKLFKHLKSFSIQRKRYQKPRAIKSHARAVRGQGVRPSFLTSCAIPFPGSATNNNRKLNKGTWLAYSVLLGQRLNLVLVFCGCRVFSGYTALWCLNREFKERRFWATQVNRKWTFCTLELWFWTKVWTNRLYKSKDT